MEIQITTNAAEVSEFARRVFHDQIPFATSLAINTTAKEFQREQREGLKDRFTIRRRWVLTGIKINRGDFATKRKLVARIHVDPARDFLTKFEEGGIKRPTGTRLAIPHAVRRTATGVVSRSFRPRALRFREVGGGMAKGEKRTFLVRAPGGRGAILQRFGRRGRGGGSTRVLYTFAPAARIDPILEFEETGARVVRDRFEPNFEAAFDRAVRTAR